MVNSSEKSKPTYEQFREEWLEGISRDDLPPLQKGLRFGAKLVTQWLGVTTDDDDFVICDGTGDGGIDIAYLQRADSDPAGRDGDAGTTNEGDTWYLVQSKYGTSFAGSDTIVKEGRKVVNTLLGGNQNLSEAGQLLVEKLNLFRDKKSDADRIVLVFATTDPISQQDRQALEDIKIIGRERGIRNLDVEEVSLLTIWEAQDGVESQKISVPVRGQFVEQSSGLLVGTVSLMDLFDFLKSYQGSTGNLDQIYERNVRQFLGGRRKVNKGIINTLKETPDKFGLYNNGITVVVSNYSRYSNDPVVMMHDPYVVNGCQTTRAIWQVLDGKLNAGGTGHDAAAQSWKERASRGGVVTKIVRSDEAEITNITRFTNSQNSVRDQDFIALHSGFRGWAAAMEKDYRIFLEIQRGGKESRKAWEKQHPEERPFDDYVNAFDLIKVYGAGWLGHPGLAFGKNAPFLPKGSVYERIVLRQGSEAVFGGRDLYAAYKIKCVADEVGFGRNADRPSRRQSRYLFYHVIMQMLSNVILLTPAFREPPVSDSHLTDAVLKLGASRWNDQLSVLRRAALVLVDQYLTLGGVNSAYTEKSFTDIHNGDLNAFLKAETLGTDRHSQKLVQLLAQYNQGFASIPMPTHPGNPTPAEFVAEALLAET